LAELETAFGVDNIADLAARFSGGKIGAAGMIAILGAALRGGGNLLEDEDVRDMSVEGGVEGAVRLTARLLSAAFLPHTGGSEREASPPNPLKPQRAD
jgi:hypothetical protein